MDILVCVKQVPATTQVEVDPDTGVLKRDGAASKINPYDLYALEAAFALCEEHGGRVDVLSMGPPQAKAALLEALCMGADGACLLCDGRFAGADVLATSRALAAGIRCMGSYNLILCGKQTTDGDTAQVGPEVAELLGLPHASYVLAAQPQAGGIQVQVNLGDVVQTQLMPLPCLLTLEKDTNTPRLPSYQRSCRVKEEDIRVLTLEDFADGREEIYGLAGSPTQVEKIFPPPQTAGRQLMQGTADELADALHELLYQGKYI